MILTPKNWSEFQHYKDRRPVWIKLHRALLDDYEFHSLPIASKALAPLLWLLASEYSEGKIDASPIKIAFRVRMSEDAFVMALKPLVLAGFFMCDSELLADCYPVAIPEKRREETETETEKTPPTPHKYAFEGKVIKLKQEDFNRWQEAYPHLNGTMVGILTSRDDWYAQPGNEQVRRRWFQATSQWLSKLNQEAHERAPKKHKPISNVMAGTKEFYAMYEMEPPPDLPK